MNVAESNGVVVKRATELIAIGRKARLDLHPLVGKKGELGRVG